MESQIHNSELDKTKLHAILKKCLDSKRKQLKQKPGPENGFFQNENESSSNKVQDKLIDTEDNSTNMKKDDSVDTEEHNEPLFVKKKTILNNEDIHQKIVAIEHNKSVAEAEESKLWPICDSIIGKDRPNSLGWYSLVGGMACAVVRAKANKETFKFYQTNNMYTGKTLNSFDVVYKPWGKCRVTKKTKVYNLASWNCPEIQTRDEWHAIFQKYFVPNKDVEDSVNNFVREYFGKHTLGIHIRATDRATDKGNLKKHIHKVPTSRIINAIDNYIRVNPQTDKIFVASDNVPQLEEIKSKYPDLVIYQNAHRSKGSHPIHDGHDGWIKLLEVVVDAHLLSKTKYLLKCFSEVSLASTVINNKLDWDLLNIPDGIKIPKWRLKIGGFKYNKYTEKKIKGV